MTAKKKYAGYVYASSRKQAISKLIGRKPNMKISNRCKMTDMQWTTLTVTNTSKKSCSPYSPTPEPLPRFYFTEHHKKLNENTLPTDLNFVQVIYNMFTRAFFALPTQIVDMCNTIFGTEVTLPLIKEQRTHIYNAISNLSWDIPEIQELLYFHHPEDVIQISDRATQESQDESTDVHDTYGLHRPESNSETEEGIDTSTPAHSDQWSPPEMDDTIIHTNPDE